MYLELLDKKQGKKQTNKQKNMIMSKKKYKKRLREC